MSRRQGSDFAGTEDLPSGAPSQPLPRRLGLMGVLFLTLSVTTPASSVFVIVPGMLQAAGTGALWAVAAAGLICVATAYVYAELSSAWPLAGGEYVMVAQTLGPRLGFAMLGVNLFNNLLFPPVAALGISALVAPVFPGLPAIPTAIAVVGIAALLSVLNIRLNAWITGLFLLAEMLALAAIVGLGFWGSARGIGGMLTHPLMARGGGLVPAAPASIGVATTIAIFAFNGYGVAVYFGEEMHEAPRLIAKAVLGALWAALLFEAAPTLAALAAAPDLRSLLVSENPFGEFVRVRGGPVLAAMVAGAVALAIMNAVIATVLANARFLYGTGRDRSWGSPVDQWLTAIHPRFGSPWLGTLIVGAIGIACCFLPLSFLLLVSGAGLVFIYAGIALAAIAGRVRGVSSRTKYRMPLYPFWPILTLAALAYVSWSTFRDESEGRPALIATAAQVGLSLLYYEMVLRRRGRWAIHVPHDAGDASLPSA